MSFSRFFHVAKPSDGATPVWRKRLLYRTQAMVQRLGIPGIVAIGLLVFCAMIWGSAILKLSKERGGLEQELEGIALPVANADGLEARKTELAAFYASFPESSRTATLIGQLHAEAEVAGVRLASTDFRPAEQQSTAVPALVVTVDTVAGHEPTVKFVNLVLTGMPNAALEAIALKRGKLVDTALETQLRFRLYVKTP